MPRPEPAAEPPADADTEDVVDPTWRAIEADRAVQAEALDDLARKDRKDRVARTVAQVAPASALVTLAEYAVSFLRVDMAPMDEKSTTTPTVVIASAIGVLTWWFSKRANRDPG